MRSDEIIKMQTVLEFTNLSIQKRVSRSFMSSCTLELFIDRLSDEYVFELKTKILAQHNKQKYSVGIEIPKNLWQYLRQVVLPQWWLKKVSSKTKSGGTYY